MVYIDTTQKLNNFIDKALKSKVIFIDTEFMREKTYYPQLSLIQFQIGDESFIFDPFCFKNIKPLAKVFDAEDVLKVFHASAQDLEILYYETGVVPHPLFDTQLAAAVTDGLNQPGLANLLKKSLGISIDKSEGFTDWNKRPLTEKQLEYAIEDVLYLPELFDYQCKKMKMLGRESWLDYEFVELSRQDRFDEDPRERYMHLKHVNKLKPRQLALARELAAWRENRAKKLNIPRKWVLTDEQVTEICKRDPKTIDALFNVRGVQNSLKISEAREVLDALKAGRKCDKADYPQLADSGAAEENVDDIVFLMNALLKLRATQNCIAQSVIANNHDLVDLARGKRKKSPLLKGWRKELVGQELIDLLDGKIGITCSNGALKVQHLG
ncbi:MAG: ribonuclease D [Phoenicibacter congonensis]|uniref:Ribonuclease D n=1 Tax=Phoenicibacter congonensis TaxID=1944646 RepID=A0AA43UB34_9ACTN|nr:ribonuclease D [Phoenicibacter congonensis]